MFDGAQEGRPIATDERVEEQKAGVRLRFRDPKTSTQR